MTGLGGECIPGLDPRPAEVINASQGHASLFSSLTPGNQSWSLSTGQSVPHSVYPYDPQSQLPVSTDSQSSNYSTSHAPIPPSLGSASVTNEYSGYPSYSSSSVPYTYSSSSAEYQNYYYNYPQPVHQSSAQQVDPNPNTGAAYQPLSSFQNSGSYVGPPSYLGTYYNAGDYQTSGYGQSSYNYQNNSMNDGNYGNYQSRHYPNYAATDTNSAQSSTTANSLYYQQQYNQWSYGYNHAAPTANGASGSENVISSVNSLPAGCSTAGVSGGYPYVSNQQPPPGTTSWRNESGSSVPLSQGKDNGTMYPLNNGLESSALGSQCQNTNQSYIQMPPVSNFQNENHESEQKAFYSQAPSLQHSCSNQVPQSLQQQPHPSFTTDAHQVSKVQILVNPRIAPNSGFGMLKSQNEKSVVHAAVKPAYLSVSLPKVGTKPISQDDAQGAANGTLPSSLRAYVERAFARCKDDAQRSASQNIMKEIITKATEEGTLFAKNWDSEPLFPVPSSSSNIIDYSNSQSLVSGSFLPKVKRSPGRGTKSRWEPVAEDKVDDTLSSSNVEALSKVVSNFNGWNGVKFVASQQQAPLNKIGQSPRKKLRVSDFSNSINGDASGDSDKEQSFTKFRASAMSLETSANERKRREDRFKRFEKGQGNKVEMNHLKSKNTEGGNAYTKGPSAMRHGKRYEDVSGVAVEDINWDSLTVKGTCQEIEKRYLRLTSAPDPATVRPEGVLEKALEMVQSSKKNYLYKCDQLKSNRQDLTVQRIQNTFTAKVYETHARFALEAGDLQEYNQCQSQLKRLYSEGIEGNHKEFSAYNLLYIILHTDNKRDLLSSMMRLSYDVKADKAVKHALAVRGAVSSGNYFLFFKLYNEAPNLNACVMDLYTEKMRFEAIKCMCKSYRPLVPVSYVSRVLGFSKILENGDSKGVVDGTEDCKEWLKAHGAVFTVGNNEVQLDTKASSSNLFMPEPEDAVAHGDANLGVDDFLARAS